jgi:hypothetical protein
MEGENRGLYDWISVILLTCVSIRGLRVLHRQHSSH